MRGPLKRFTDTIFTHIFVMHQYAKEDFGKDSRVGNVDNEPNGNVKIVTGSFQGTHNCILRVEYQIEDLMVEQQLGAPVCLALGKFYLVNLADTRRFTSCRLVVYQVAAMGGSGSPQLTTLL